MSLSVGKNVESEKEPVSAVPYTKSDRELLGELA